MYVLKCVFHNASIRQNAFNQRLAICTKHEAEQRQQNCCVTVVEWSLTGTMRWFHRCGRGFQLASTETSKEDKVTTRAQNLLPRCLKYRLSSPRNSAVVVWIFAVVYEEIFCCNENRRINRGTKYPFRKYILCVYPEETWRFDAKINHNPSEFCWLDMKGVTQVLSVCSAKKKKKCAKPSSLKVVILCCTWFPCPVSDLLDTRCMLSFEKSLPPRVFVCLCVCAALRGGIWYS